MVVVNKQKKAKKKSKKARAVGKAKSSKKPRQAKKTVKAPTRKTAKAPPKKTAKRSKKKASTRKASSAAKAQMPTIEELAPSGEPAFVSTDPPLRLSTRLAVGMWDISWTTFSLVPPLFGGCSPPPVADTPSSLRS